MKAESPTPHDQALSKVLREWKTESPLPPRFNEHVWNRIARAEMPSSGFFQKWIAPLFLRPAFAIAYAALLLTLGAVAGLWQGHAVSERNVQSLETRYVQSIDPYQMPRH